MTTIPELTSAYTDYLTDERKLERNTVKGYLSDLRGLDAFLMGKAVQDISRADLRAFMRHLSAQGRSSGTIRRKMFGFGTFFKWLHLEQAIVSANVSAGIVLPKRKRKEPTLFSEDQVRVFATTPGKTPRETLAFGLLAWLGLRTSECLNLRVGDVLLEQGVIILRGTKNGDDWKLPIPQALRDLCASQTSGRAADAWLLAGSMGGHWTREDFRHAFNRHLRKCQLDGLGLTPRSLRHSCFSHKEQRGVTLRTIQGISRHKRLDSLQQYLHVSSTALANAVEISPLAEVTK